MISVVPRLSVCICTHNRPDDLRACLDGLRRQTAPTDAFEVLVVDSASAPAVATTRPPLLVGLENARLLRLGQAGLSRARNLGARAARAPYIAYLDDDSVPAPDWVAAALAASAEATPPAAVIGGRVLPQWEAPLPRWWPGSLRGVLSIVEEEGAGEYRSAALPPGLEPCGANLVLHVPTLLAEGGFATAIGRCGDSLLSDEEVHVAWRLQERGHSVRYDPRLVVRHRIQAARLTPAWLLARLYGQGLSTVLTRRLLGQRGSVWREFPRRLLVAALLAPALLLPRSSTRLLACRWRLAYARGFIRAALGGIKPAAQG